jgi:hypothetical protein
VPQAEADPEAEPQVETKPDRIDLEAPTPWHGVLAPEDVWSGDGRRFAEGLLGVRDLPIPLTWQKATDTGHDGSVVIGKIDSIERAGNMMQGSGTFLTSPEADEVVGLISEFGQFGVSVDADSAEMEFDEEAEEGKVTFTSPGSPPPRWSPSPRSPRRSSPRRLGGCRIRAGRWVTCVTRTLPAYDPDACAKKQARSESISLSDTSEAFVSDKPWSQLHPGRLHRPAVEAACIMHICSGPEKS